MINSYLVICMMINKPSNINTPVGGGAAFFEFRSSLAALAALLEQKMTIFLIHITADCCSLHLNSKFIHTKRTSVTMHDKSVSCVLG